MCGRYTLYTHEDDLASLFEVITYPLTERFNVAPTQTVPIIVQQPTGERVMTPARWGLIPHWVADPTTFKATLFNARAESAAEKPSFRDAMRSRRCIVPATGFYEWRKTDDSKQPYHIQRTDGQPMALAGLWSVNTRGQESIISCTILTVDANHDMEVLHDRMPVILEREAWNRWEDPDELDPQRLEDLLVPADEGVITMYPVGREVGNSRVDEPSLVRPLA
jgi:putative SOS response-associated peptidase YedK